VELVPTLSVPDNVTHFQVFEDDKHIIDFGTCLYVFVAQIIDEEEMKLIEMDLEGFLNLNTNTIP